MLFCNKLYFQGQQVETLKQVLCHKQFHVVELPKLTFVVLREMTVFSAVLTCVIAWVRHLKYKKQCYKVLVTKEVLN